MADRQWRRELTKPAPAATAPVLPVGTITPDMLGDDSTDGGTRYLSTDGSGVAVWVSVATLDEGAPVPVAPSVSKVIDGSNNVRFIVEQDDQQQQYEAYRFDLHMNGGGDLRIRKFITSQDTGSPLLRDKWAEFSTAEQTLAGYTPGPSETFWINVVQVGDTESSPDQLQEL